MKEAIALLERIGGEMSEGEIDLRLTWAEALHASGDGEAARAAIAATRDRLLELAERLSDVELRASFLRRVPENARTLALARAWIEGETP
jgi:hypothetical protein